MNKLIYVSLVFLMYSLNAKDFNDKSVPKNPRKLKSTNLLAKGPEDLLDEDEENFDEYKNDNVTGIKGSNSPKVPSNGSDINSNKERDNLDVSPEKRTQEIKVAKENTLKLEKKGNNQAIKQISHYLLKNQYTDVRSAAAQSLGRLRKGLKALHRASVTDASVQVIQQSYKSLEIIGSRSSLKHFRVGIESKDPEIKAASLKGIGKTRNSHGRELILERGLTAEEPIVVSSALSGLGYYSRKEDLEIFKKHLESDHMVIRTGAVSGLGYSNAMGSIDLLEQAYLTNPELAPEIIYSLTQKRNLGGTLALLKMKQTIKNENYITLIEKEIQNRRAFGRYAIVKTAQASVKKEPKPNSKKLVILKEGDVVKVKSTTEKFYKVKMNNEMVEDRYHLLQTTNKDENSKKQIMEGWVFGPKIQIFSILDNRKAISTSNKNKIKEDLQIDEDSEDERVPTGTTVKEKKPTDIIKPETKSDSKDADFNDEDEDE